MSIRHVVAEMLLAPARLLLLDEAVKLRLLPALGAILFCAAAARAEPPKEPKTEFTPVPIVGGNSDVGFGGGAILSLARLRPELEPYLWRAELTGLTTLRPSQGKLTVPYQDYYFLLHLPHVRDSRFELTFRLSYTHESTVKYYGVGNRNPLPAGRSLTDPYFEFDWVHPTFSVDALERLFRPFSLELGLLVSHHWLDVPEGTKLAEDAKPNSRAHEFIEPLVEHSVATFSYGLLADTRDSEISATRGFFHSVRVDWSPGGTREFPFNFWRLDAAARFYFPIGDDGSTIAVRAVADLLFGDPPIYELANYDQYVAFGGPTGVRGVPGQRYHGKVKFFGNAELRKNLFRFHMLGKENRFGVATFVDAGRLYAGYSYRPDLDGTDIGLKLGLGGGIRMLAGQSFVLRIDAAWSPDARPLGVYLASGQVF